MSPDERILLRRLAGLNYVDPADALRRSFSLQLLLSKADHLPDQVRNLRTTKLRRAREWWQLSLFTHAVGVAEGMKVLLSVEEDQHWDGVTVGRLDETLHYAPIQLKELPSKDRNPRASLERLEDNINRKDYRGTTVAIYLERAGHYEASELPRLKVTCGPVRLFGFSADDQSQIALSHDLSAADAEPRFWTVPHPALTDPRDDPKF